MRAIALVPVLLALASTSAVAQPPDTVFGTAGRILALAADGVRVAASTEVPDKESCDRIVVFNTQTRKYNVYKTFVHCGEQPVVEFLTKELALASTHAAWVAAAGGNTLELVLQVGKPGKKPAFVDLAANDGGAAGGSAGDYLGNVRADGGLIAYNTWRVTNAGAVTNAQLRIVAAGKTKTIATGPATRSVVAVDAGRIAALSGATVTIYSNAGAVLRKVALPGVPTGVALQGPRLVVLRGASLFAYDAETGALVKTIPGIGSGALRDVHNGVALLTAGSQVRLVRLSDGKRAVLTAPRVVVDAELEAPGLSYAYNVPSGTSLGRIVFVSWARVQALLAS